MKKMLSKRALSAIVAVAMVMSVLTASMSTIFAAGPLNDGSLVAHYDMSLTSEGKLADVSGNDLDAEIVNGQASTFTGYEDSYVWNLDGNTSSQYAKLPRGIEGSSDSITISTTLYTGTSRGQWVWSIGTNKADNPSGYLFLNPRRANDSLISGGMKLSDSSNLKVGEKSGMLINTEGFTTLTVTLDDTGYMQLYVDGVLTDSNAMGGTLQDVLDSGTSSVNDYIGYIGQSLWNQDSFYQGYLTDLQFYDKALSDSEVFGIIPTEEDNIAAITSVAMASLFQGSDSKDRVTMDLNLTSSVAGIDLTWRSSDPSVITDTGVVTTPAAENKQVTMSLFFTYNGTNVEETIDVTVLKGEGLVAEYDMTRTDDGKLADVTGNGYDARLTDNVSDSDFVTENGGTYWNFQNDNSKYAYLPLGIVDSTDFTIQVRSTVGAADNQMLWVLGTHVAAWGAPSPDNYIFLNPKQDTASSNIRAGIKVGNELLFGNTDLGSASPQALDYNTYYTLTITSEEESMHLYVDGEHVSTLDHGYNADDFTEILAGKDDYMGFIGFSTWVGDAGYTGKLSNFKVYNYTMSDEEVAGNYEGNIIHDALAAASDIPNKDDIRGNVSLLSEYKGAVITWETSRDDIIDVQSHENPGYDPTPAGVVTRPENDTDITVTPTVQIGVEVVTGDPITLTVKAKPEELTDEDYEGYLMAHFVGEGTDGEQIYFSSSRNGLYWTDLNDGDLILESDVGEEGVRDPFIIRSAEGDKFYLIATDLSINARGGWTNAAASTTGSQCIVIWESTDLVNWTDARLVQVAPENAGCAWAPEAFYDEETGEYLVFWASRVGSGDNFGNHKIWYAKTRDFYTFTEPQIYIEDTHDVIDTTIIQYGDGYYRFSKNESAAQVTMDYVDKLLYSEAEPVESGMLNSLVYGSDYGAVEGPEIYYLYEKDQYCLVVDRYDKGTGYLPLLAEDLDAIRTGDDDWTVASSYYMGANTKRHGSFLSLTKEEYNLVMETWSDWGTLADPNEAEQTDPILEYDFEDGTAKDVTGNGNDGTLYGSAAVSQDSATGSNALVLDGTSGTYAAFPQGFFDGRDTFTLSFDLKSKTDGTGTNFFNFALGQDSTRYLFLRNRVNGLSANITTNSWGAEQVASVSGTYALNQWRNITMVVTPQCIQIFEDGILAAENDDIGLSISNLGSNTLAYLGRSFYGVDSYFNGSYDNVRVYNRALTEVEIAEANGKSAVAVKSVSTSEDYTVSAQTIDADSRTVTMYISKNNSDVTDLSSVPLEIELASGASANIGNGIFDLTSPVEIEITMGDVQEIWTISAVLSNNPVLGGQYADPDIGAFEGKYYIYPTTDGFTSWSGYQFHVFSSDDLVDWVDEGIILDVANDYINREDNDNGYQGVPWAVGSAWAPSIEEKDGKYYFYFCAKRTDGTSCIGVAVSDSPTGPFVAQDEPLVTPEICSSNGVSIGQTIDPNIYTDEDTGISYMLFGNGSESNGAAIVQLGDDMMSLVPGTMANIRGATDIREAITVTKIDDLYHFTWSVDDTGSENYSIHYGTSTDLYGPITYRGAILQKDTSQDILGTGHHDILQVPGTEEYYIVYHRFVTPLGQYTSGFGYHRETCIDKLEVDTDGYFQTVTPTHEGVTEGEPLIIVTFASEDDSMGTIEGKVSQTIAKDKGTTKTVKAVAEDGYEFVSWSDGVTDAERTASGISSNTTITAEFRLSDNDNSSSDDESGSSSSDDESGSSSSDDESGSSSSDDESGSSSSDDESGSSSSDDESESSSSDDESGSSSSDDESGSSSSDDESGSSSSDGESSENESLRDKLEKLVEEYLQMQQGAYTAVSWNAFQEALANAQAVLADENAAQEEIQAALTALETAINLLEKDGASQDSSDNPDQSNSETDGSDTSGSNVNTGDFIPMFVLLIGGFSAIFMLILMKKKKSVEYDEVPRGRF